MGIPGPGDVFALTFRRAKSLGKLHSTPRRRSLFFHHQHRVQLSTFTYRLLAHSAGQEDSATVYLLLFHSAQAVLHSETP